MTIHLRADRVLFRLSGPDAHKLLNDVVTGRVPNAEGPAAWWALLSPQGKILAEGLVGWHEEALWLDVHASIADDFFKRMRMYKLRANVTIESLKESHRVGWSADKAQAAIVQAAVYDSVSLGYRVIDKLENAADWQADDTAYARARIANGLAELGQDFAADTTFAHDIGMDQLDGIDFAKGCYVGQEVVSRMKHRGTARRRPVVVSGINAEAGASVLAKGRDSGSIGRVVDGKAVGIVRLDRFSADGIATIGDAPVTLTLPNWASYALGEAAPAEEA